MPKFFKLRDLPIVKAENLTKLQKSDLKIHCASSFPETCQPAVMVYLLKNEHTCEGMPRKLASLVSERSEESPAERQGAASRWSELTPVPEQVCE